MKNRARNPRLKGTRVNPLKLDPTRTTMLRKAAIVDVRRRFARLALAIDELIVRQDSFGLNRRKNGPPSPFATNVFCATGEGGGVDPTCGKGEGDVSSQPRDLTGSEQYAVSDYKGRGYNYINRTLREKGMEEFSDGTRQQVRTLDSLIARSKTAEDMTLVRVLDGKRIGDKHLKEGAVIEDKGFMSTSTSEAKAHRAVADASVGGVKTSTVIEIRVPKGTTALDLEAHRVGGSIVKPMAGEGEYLLPRGTRLKIVKVDKEARRATAEIVANITTNAFCPTGEGGGVDPTCSPIETTPSGKDVSGDHVDQFLEGMENGEIEGDSANEIGNAITSKQLNKIVRTERGKIVGAVSYKTVGDGAISIKHMGSMKPGVGREMMKYLQSKFSWINTDNTKSEALGFYKKLGFEIGVSGDGVWKKPATNAFCPTGPGGGVDPSCDRESSVQDYTTDRFQQVNGGLRSGVLEKHDQRIVKDIDAFLESAPKRVGATIRSFNADPETFARIESQIRSGEYSDKAYLSTRKSPAITDRAAFVQKIGSSGQVVFKVTGKSGVDVSKHSLNPGEGEVLYPRGTKFKVTKFEKLSSGTLLAELTENAMATNERWELKSSPEQLAAFQEWLKRQLKWYVVGMTEDQLWARYVQEGFRKGAGRAFDDLRSKRGPTFRSDDFLQGERRQFLSSSFRRPETVEKVKILASRTFEELNNVGEEIKLKLGRVLTDGLVQGKNPRDIAREMRDKLAMPMKRAEAIARTEIIRAHAEGQLSAMEDLGIDEVGVMVEWSTAGDDRVCPSCSAMEGVVLKLSEAHGMIPRHVNCRCSFLPANVGESRGEQVRGKTKIERQIDLSARIAGDAFDVGIEIGKQRPRALVSPTKNVLNAFCPTGPGGGVDPSCGKGSTVYHFTSEEGEAGIKESGAVRESEGLLGKAAYFTSSDSSSNVTGMKAAGKRVSATIASDNILELKGPIAAADWVDANKLPHESSDDVAGVARRLGFDVVRLKLKQGDYVLGLRPDAIKTNAFCPTGPGGGVDPTCGAGEGGGSTSAPLRYRDHKGTNHEHNAEIVKASKVKVITPEKYKKDVTEALAHVLESKFLSKQMEGVTVEVTSLGNRHGNMSKHLYVSQESLEQYGPGFMATIVRHELEHKILTSQGVPSSKQESRVRHTAGTWAAIKYGNMAKTNPRAAEGFKKAAIEQGVKVL